MENQHYYGYGVVDFEPGERVALHPGTDHWMRGDKYGTVVKLHARSLTVAVKMDRSGKTFRVSPSRITKVS